MSGNEEATARVAIRSQPTPAQGGVVRCGRCALYPRCLSLGLGREALAGFDALVERPRPLRRGEALLRRGEGCRSLYVVRSGSLKRLVAEPGQGAQVSHFHLPGELVGLDAIGAARCPASVVALETTFVCALPFASLDALAQRAPALRRALFRRLSRELCHDRRRRRRLSAHTAEQRLAGFVLELSARFHARGCAPDGFRLSMSRSDIASHLGLALETVSRVLVRFQDRGLVTLEGRELCIDNPPALAALLEKQAKR